MKTAMVPISLKKTGDTCDENNYRPIALVSAASKIVEICILGILETYLQTYDHQFGFKSRHSTDLCTSTVKSLIKHYTDQNTPVYSCLLEELSLRTNLFDPFQSAYRSQLSTRNRNYNTEDQ